MEEGHKFQLVIQLPGNTQQHFHLMISLEECLADAFDGTTYVVDGHDFGSGTGNIFIDTNDPRAAFDILIRSANLTAYPSLKVAYRSFEEDGYTLVWPQGENETFELL